MLDNRSVERFIIRGGDDDKLGVLRYVRQAPAPTSSSHPISAEPVLDLVLVENAA